MAQLTPGTGGPSDSQGGTLQAATYLDSEVRTDVVTDISWSFGLQAPEFFTAPSYEPQWIFDGDNVLNSASFSLNGQTPEFLGGTDHNLATYVPGIEHSNAEVGQHNITLIQEKGFGEHSTLLATYVQNFEHVNVESSIFNLDVLERGKKKPRYTWTTGAF